MSLPHDRKRRRASPRDLCRAVGARYRLDRASEAGHRRILTPLRPAPGEWDSLRLAAKAADRAKAAEELRPEFEKRLKRLGYGPLGIAHAFSILSGPGTVAEALEALERYSR